MKAITKNILLLPVIVFTAYKTNAQVNKSLSNLTSPTAVNQTLLPYLNNTTDLGSSTLGWKDIYISNRVYLNSALVMHAPGSGNFFTGVYSGNASVSGANNTGTGKYALQQVTTGSYNTVSGAYALYSNSEGSYNTANGYSALRFNSKGNSNTANGSSALYYNTTGDYNTAVGYYALYANTTGRENTASGYYALRSNTTGYFNTAAGAWSLYYNVTGIYNTSNGHSALYSNTTGNSNTAVGSMAMFRNTKGYSNVAVGRGAMFSNIEGKVNTAIGEYALYYNDMGSSNTAVGNSALTNNTSGFYNVAFGNSALYQGVIGSFNTAVGTQALYHANGSYNTAIGYAADINQNDPYMANATAIGYNTIVQQSNQVRVGNTTVTSIGGQVGWTIFSDGRYKRNIKEDVAGLAFINSLRPVTYTIDTKSLNAYLNKERRQTVEEINESARAGSRNAIEEAGRIVHDGFVAQEVEQAANKLGFSFSGVDKPKTEDGLYGLRYDNFVVPLVKAVQELSKQNDSLKAQNNDLLRRIERLESLINISSNSSVQLSKNIATSDVILEQNFPNPATNTTVIHYTLPHKFSSAQLIITDNNGRMIKRINTSGVGERTLNIDVSTLLPGTYNYSLVIDGKIRDTKQMAIVK